MYIIINQTSTYMYWIARELANVLAKPSSNWKTKIYSSQMQGIYILDGSSYNYAYLWSEGNLICSRHLFTSAEPSNLKSNSAQFSYYFIYCYCLTISIVSKIQGTIKV